VDGQQPAGRRRRRDLGQQEHLPLGESDDVGKAQTWLVDPKATFDYNKSLRVGDRVVSIGEKPYFDPAGKDWREARGLPSWHDE